MTELRVPISRAIAAHAEKLFHQHALAEVEVAGFIRGLALAFDVQIVKVDTDADELVIVVPDPPQEEPPKRKPPVKAEGE